jgi:hypothetical protein
MERKRQMADRFEQLKLKYQSVLNFIQAQNVQLQNLNLEGDKLLIRATAPSQDLKNRLWDQIKLVDPTYSELIADIQAPPQQSGPVHPQHKRTPYSRAIACQKLASNSTEMRTST